MSSAFPTQAVHMIFDGVFEGDGSEESDGVGVLEEGKGSGGGAKPKASQQRQAKRPAAAGFST